MTKRRTLTKAQKFLKQRILDAYSKRGGFRHIPIEWDKNLWKKASVDIYDYIDSRFRTTLDVVEYYSAMVMLYKHVPNQELLVEFHDSPQWLEAARTYHTNQTEALPNSKQKLTRINENEGDNVEMPHTIKFDGEI